MTEETPKPTLFKRIDNLARGLANGITFGMADYIAAKANSMLTRQWWADWGPWWRGQATSRVFEKELAAEAARTAQAQKEGYEEIAGRLTGSVVLGLGVTRLLGGFARYEALKSFAPQIGKLPPRIAAAATEQMIAEHGTGISIAANAFGAATTATSGVLNSRGAELTKLRATSLWVTLSERDTDEPADWRERGRLHRREFVNFLKAVAPASLRGWFPNSDSEGEPEITLPSAAAEARAAPEAKPMPGPQSKQKPKVKPPIGKGAKIVQPRALMPNGKAKAKITRGMDRRPPLP